jgi:hypothetical protein
MKPEPRILLHPNIPQPLHGISPRVVLGSGWWDAERQRTYKARDFTCYACGVHKYAARYFQHLEAHECYAFDYDRGLLTFKRCVALCHCCHNFIHDGRMMHLVDSGEWPEGKWQSILAHGMWLLEKAGLLEQWETRHDHPCDVPWSDWRMEIMGKQYGPSTSCPEDWQAGLWKEWKP